MTQGTTTPRPLDMRVNALSTKRIGWKPVISASLCIMLVLIELIGMQALAGEQEKKFDLSIPATKADEAVKTLARQTGHSVIFQSADIEHIETKPLNGRYTVQQALDTLLKSTALSSGLTRHGVITISRRLPNKNLGQSMKKKKTLLATFISFLFSSGGSQYVLAQQLGNDDESSADSPDMLLEEVVVTGIRATLKKNLDMKREAAAFVDAITAEDIGKFPDKNVADALQRIPGVSITRSGGEGQFVSIRGTSSELTLTQLNGNYVATASSSREPSRSFNFSLLPANLIESTEVYKSPQAKIDEGGLGGTIIVNTRRPLNLDSGSGFFNLEHTYADVTEDLEPQYSGLYSWKNESETVGILLSYTSQDRTSIVENISTENWTLFDDSRADESFAQESLRDTDGNEITGYAPFAVVQSRSKEARDREGYQLTFQWAPTDRIVSTFNYIGARLEQDNDNDLVLVAEWDYRDPAIVPGSVRYNGDTIVAMQLADTDLTDDTIDLQAPAIGSRRTLSTSKSDTYDLEIVYEGDNYTASLNLGNTKSTGGTSFDNLQRFFGTGGVTSTYGWDLTAGTILNYDAQASDFNGFGWRSTDAGVSSDEESYVQVDFTFDYGLSIFTSFDVGTKYRDHTIDRRFNNLVWDDGDPNNPTLWGGCCGLGFEYWHTDSNLPSAAEIASFVKTVDGLTGEAGTQTSFFSVDWDAYTAWLDQNFIRSRRDDNGRFFEINEEITSTYIQGNYETGNLSGNVGMRIVQTDQSAATFGAANGVNVGQLVTNRGSYTDVLPSFNLKWEVAEDVVVRAAAAKVVARVSYNHLGTSEDFNDPPEGSNSTTGTRGNTDLKPFESKQYDVGVEWYFRPTSALGATLFHKQIDSFVTTSNLTETRTIPNRSEPVTVVFSLPVNGTDATSTGLELFYQQAFDFGGGIIANYTYTDTSLATINNADGTTDEEPLPGTSKHQYNLSAYYETDRFSVRASYNYRDDFPEADISNGQTVFRDSYGQIDVNASYNITDALSINGSVINLTKETTERYWGQSDRLYGRSYSGRRFYIGLNYRL